ncbi:MULTISPECIES: EVE domain-containing protein [unclassified Beijerinckia]|uniref:EVE domain-containing protein n=1 Tax=unclassified Beijerinckia TaxID=2638183 RepID=UPI00089B1237|nr:MULTISPECIES: EVE domain-containing protein [unclassified Beijerinckia]MDH7795674.1 hypothetical protein [Beijerinckia sp. GAS462]SEC11362.1 EVE domain-containing protein [Beijerinckia sp. 28-YEA-48]
MKYWIGVVSRDHIETGRAGGFIQLCHGKEAPLRRIAAGDRIIFYSPRQSMNAGASLQAFTALCEMLPELAYLYDMGGGFTPYRRNTRFLPSGIAPIAPLLNTLSFTRGQRNWGYAFRRGYFQITADDYVAIAAAMGVIETDRVAA